MLTLTKDQMVARGYTLPAVYDQFVAIGMKTETVQQAGLPDHLVHPNRWDFGRRADLRHRFYGEHL